LGAAERTLYSEDRSETIPGEGKEELQLDSIPEAQQAKRLHVYVATIVLSATRGLQLYSVIRGGIGLTMRLEWLSDM